ncbi:probable protein phosphatase 2C 60 isoform X1 [Pistacia vera]|uniref:probable protein phosphatase 2C 60 isoform X1 n=1 Tax=Pistacia vera TaxID=55513 RepID=UPI0012635E08|nr:probable protein phosphatase 2C 60 isoform X1 [Pistacia vera]
MPKQRDLGPQIKDKTTSLFPITRHLLPLSLSAQNCTDAQITNEMGVYLSTPKTEKLSEDGENESLRYGVSSMQGWRATMEDAHAAYPDLDDCTSFFGVYDGHGGKAVSKFCAKYLHQQVLKHEAYSAGDIGTSAQKAFLRMDEMMRGQRGWRELAVLGDKMDKFSGMIEGLIWSPRSSEVKDHFDDWTSEEGPHSDFHGPNCGSTACVAIIRNQQLVVANAGDSRCVLSRKGQAYNLSKDHKPDLEVERDRILKAGGFIQVGRVNGSLNLARAIGDVEFKLNKALPAEKQIVTANPDITTIELCDDDEFLVLACDGIWDCLSSQQLVDYVRDQLATETKLSTICERVFEKCLAPVAGGEGCDNMTMILVQFKKPFNAGASVAEQPSACDQPSSCDQPSEPEISTAETESQSEPERNPAETESK